MVLKKSKKTLEKMDENTTFFGEKWRNFLRVKTVTTSLGANLQKSTKLYRQS